MRDSLNRLVLTGWSGAQAIVGPGAYHVGNWPAKQVEDPIEALLRAGWDNYSMAEGLRLRARVLAGRLVDPFCRPAAPFRPLRLRLRSPDLHGSFGPPVLPWRRGCGRCGLLSQRTCVRRMTSFLDARHDGCPFNSIPRLRATRIARSRPACGCSPRVPSPPTLVVTDSRHPVQSTGRRARDRAGPARAHRGGAGGPVCPTTPAVRQRLVQQRLRDGGQALQRRIGNAYQSVIADAWGLGIAPVPLRGGRSPLRRLWRARRARALARIEAHRRPAMNRPASAHSPGPPAIASMLLSAAIELRAEHSDHRVFNSVARLPGIPRRWYLLLAVLRGRAARFAISVKVRHYVPDAVVSSYSNTGENPWVEVRDEHAEFHGARRAAMAPPITTTKTTSPSSRTPT